MSLHVLDAMAREGFEQVAAIHDRRSGLRAFLGVHDTVRGPAFGGIRRRVYRDEREALFDCLRLSRAMTHKAALLDLPAETGEILSVLRYQPGEEYKAHSDYFVMGPEGRDELERNGQRIYTLFSTLHPAELGGTTSFPKAEIVVTLGKGDALAFRNVDEDGEPDPMSIHQGDRVDRGEKWLAVKWFRTKPYQL